MSRTRGRAHTEVELAGVLPPGGLPVLREAVAAAPGDTLAYLAGMLGVFPAGDLREAVLTAFDRAAGDWRVEEGGRVAAIGTATGSADVAPREPGYRLLLALQLQRLVAGPLSTTGPRTNPAQQPRSC